MAETVVRMAVAAARDPQKTRRKAISRPDEDGMNHGVQVVVGERVISHDGVEGAPDFEQKEPHALAAPLI
jgi:hypothetical protein